MSSKITNIKDEILIIEDAIPVSLQEEVINKVQGDQYFPWFLLHRLGHAGHFGKGESPGYTDPRITDSVALTHMAFDGKDKSPHYDFFRSILYFFTEKTGIEVGNIIRIRLRYTHPITGHTSEHYSAPHVDFFTNQPYSTLVYYINDSDGDTFIFDKVFDPTEEEYNPVIAEPLVELLRLTPKQGSALFFNGHRYHAGNYPIQSSTRIVINFDFTTI